VEDQYVSFSAAWFTLSLINAGLAQSKNRSGLNWWLVSLLIGPLATLLIVAWPPGGTETTSGRVTTNQAVVIGAAAVLLIIAVVAATAAGLLAQTP
jgi:hypothetical protein